MAIINTAMLNGISPYSNINKNTGQNKVNTVNNANANINNSTFSEVLSQQKETISFSKHATARLDKRNLNLSNSQMERVEKGIKMAEEKGVTDSLVVVDNISLLVNIKNKTVVTAIDNNDKKVYTNINGAVIV